MQKVIYDDTQPIQDLLKGIYSKNPHDHDAAYSVLLLYVFHKSGLIEAGMPQVQFDAAQEAFFEGCNHLAFLIMDGIALSE